SLDNRQWRYQKPFGLGSLTELPPPSTDGGLVDLQPVSNIDLPQLRGLDHHRCHYLNGFVELGVGEESKQPVLGLRISAARDGNRRLSHWCRLDNRVVGEGGCLRSSCIALFGHGHALQRCRRGAARGCQTAVGGCAIPGSARLAA